MSDKKTLVKVAREKGKRVEQLEAALAVAANGHANGKAAKVKERTVVIPPLEEEVVAVLIRGTAPFVQNAFSQKAAEMMKRKQEAGSVAKKGTKKEPKDFRALYEAAKHVAAGGWCGIPAPAFRNAMISACRGVGFKMTHGKQGVFVVADGFDARDGSALVKITKGEPRYAEHPVRNESGVADIRPRPMWDPGWEAVVRVRYPADMFTAEDVLNLLMRAGRQVGVGEGRPDSPKSCGLDWGLFDVVKVVNVGEAD